SHRVSVAEDRRFELLRGCPNTLSKYAPQRSGPSGAVRDLGWLRVSCLSADRRPICGLSLAQRLERRPDLGREQLGFFPGGEVPAPVGLVEIGEGGVGRLDPAAGGPEDLARERGEGDRELDRRWWLPGREGLGPPRFPSTTGPPRPRY